MRRFVTFLGILILIGAVAVPVIAWGPNWGQGHRMMGNWGSIPGYERGIYGNLTDEQKDGLEALDRRYYEETRALQDQIWNKSRELDIALNSPDPDIDKAKALQKEISELRAALDEKAIAYELEARKIVPDLRSGYGDGRWYGHHMGSFGPGNVHSHGYCWN